MRCRVFLLRRGGRRLPWREVQNGPNYHGNLRTYHVGAKIGEPYYFVAALSEPGDQKLKPLVPLLYEPVLAGIGNGLLVLRGFERLGDGKDAAAAVQEWRCEIVSE